MSPLSLTHTLSLFLTHSHSLSLSVNDVNDAGHSYFEAWDSEAIQGVSTENTPILFVLPPINMFHVCYTCIGRQIV